MRGRAIPLHTHARNARTAIPALRPANGATQPELTVDQAREKLSGVKGAGEKLRTLSVVCGNLPKTALPVCRAVEAVGMLFKFAFGQRLKTQVLCNCAISNV